MTTLLNYSLLLCLWSPFMLQAQFQVGLLGGATHSYYRDKDGAAEGTQLKVGFQLGATLSYQLPKLPLGISVQALYLQKGSKDESTETASNTTLHTQHYSKYTQIPITIDYHFKLPKKWSATLGLGMYYAFLYDNYSTQEYHRPDYNQISYVTYYNNFRQSYTINTVTNQQYPTTYIPTSPALLKTDLGAVARISLGYQIHPKVQLGFQMNYDLGLKNIRAVNSYGFELVTQEEINEKYPLYNTSLGLALKVSYKLF